MPKRIVSYLVTLLLLLCASELPAISNDDIYADGSEDMVQKREILTIIQPFDKGVYEEEYISVSLEIDLDRVKNGKKVAVCKVKIYRRAFLSKYYKVVPPGYEKRFFHNEEYEKKCDMCHDMSVNEEEGVAFYDISESNCFDCHQSLLYKRFAHAPTVNFVCLPCHNGKTGIKNRKYKGRSKFLYPDPIGDTCFKCHKKNYKKWTARKNMHDPVGAGKCNLCHNPHSSDVNKNFLRKQYSKARG